MNTLLATLALAATAAAYPMFLLEEDAPQLYETYRVARQLPPQLADGPRYGGSAVGGRRQDEDLVSAADTPYGHAVSVITISTISTYCVSTRVSQPYVTHNLDITRRDTVTTSDAAP